MWGHPKGRLFLKQLVKCVHLNTCAATGGLASRVKRNDTMARRLEKQEKLQRAEDSQENYDGMSWSSREQWVAVRNKIGTALTR